MNVIRFAVDISYDLNSIPILGFVIFIMQILFRFQINRENHNYGNYRTGFELGFLMIIRKILKFYKSIFTQFTEFIQFLLNFIQLEKNDILYINSSKSM